MLKYHFRVFDVSDNLILSSIVPAESVFAWIERYKDLGIIKCYIISEEGEN